MEYLSLEIFDLAGNGQGSRYAVLSDDAGITITDTSEIFASGNAWSHPFTLNVHANAHIFGSSGNMHGARLHEQIDRRRARLWVRGLPMLLGYLRLGDEADVDADGNVDVTLEGGQKTFDEMIEGAKANQVPLMGDVLIGMALWRKRWTQCMLELKASAKLSNGKTTGMSAVTFGESKTVTVTANGEDDESAVQAYPRMVFPVLPEGVIRSLSGSVRSVDCINTDTPYDDAHPYCNTALCYQKYGYEKVDDEGNITNNYDGEPEAMRGYEVMPADRVNSAPNFYVIYWIRCLMKHLGIHIEENQMMDVEDLRRLFFVNTNCAYKEPERLRNNPSEGWNQYMFATDDGSIRRLVPEFFGDADNTLGEGKTAYLRRWSVSTDDRDSGLTDVKFTVDSGPSYNPGHVSPSDVPSIDGITVKVAGVTEWSDADREHYERQNGYLHEAYATSECFPDADISEVIKAIESGFGIRLVFSDSYQRVRIVLLKNLFRSMDVQQVACEITSEYKTENCIRGFRMTYGDIDDTAFHYKGFDDMLPHKGSLWQDNSDTHDYSQWNLNADYGSLMQNISAFDKTCYVTPDTGNAYGIKVDKDAKRYEDLHPSLFEYAGFMDAEDGDCTGEEETIETVNVGFSPAIMNDVNFETERENGERRQKYALFVGETMRPRRPDLNDGTDYNASDARYEIYGKEGMLGKYGPVAIGGSIFKGGSMTAKNGVVKPGEFSIRSDMSVRNLGETIPMKARLIYHTAPSGTSSGGGEIDDTVAWEVSIKAGGHITEGYRLYLQDNYEPNDEGISPIEKHEWGVTLGIMRGSGSDARVDYMPDPQDGEGNDTWEVVSGSSVTASPDTCDSYGNIFDYTADGQADEQDTTGRFSLKLRAEKPNPKFDASQPEGDSNRRYLEITNPKLRQRGLCDQFYKEYSYWVRNARIANMTVRMELAQLLAIDKTKKVTVGDITGFIRKMQYSVNNRTGLGMVTMEIMYI